MDIKFPEEGLNIRVEVFIGCDEKCKSVEDINICELDENKALLLDELEPLRLVESENIKRMLDDDEIQQIELQHQRRQRVTVFLEMVEQRGRIGLETLLQELKSKNEEYILSKWVSNSKMLNATQKENLRRCILENFEKIADDIDETISSLTIKAQDERSYKSGNFVLSQALKCDKTLVRFYCAAKGTRIERLTRSAPARLGRRKKPDDNHTRSHPLSNRDALKYDEYDHNETRTYPLSGRNERMYDDT
ncbi:uncharacterized protein LOC134232952 [Saccostrea cucullata]|uniref:uncharacterized protein LOC134232523 n=1 Tax=Saccostrea cuccullata TaxID=36930 RepID=UPI002ED47F69